MIAKQTRFISALKKNDDIDAQFMDDVRLALEEDVRGGFATQLIGNVFCRAVEKNMQRVVQLMLEENSLLVNLSNVGTVKTPLTCAVGNGFEEIANLLLEFGANVDKSGNDGLPPLYWASVLGSTKMVAKLLNAGANVNIKTTFLCNTPLHVACNSEVLKLLLSAGAIINVTCVFGNTPLYNRPHKERSLIVTYIKKRKSATLVSLCTLLASYDLPVLLVLKIARQLYVFRHNEKSWNIARKVKHSI